MSEKPESDEFEEEDAEDAAPGGDEVDVDHIMRDVESQRRRAPKGAEPAWRRLERVMEERRTAELMSDFDDYEIADAATLRRSPPMATSPTSRPRTPTRPRAGKRNPAERGLRSGALDFVALGELADVIGRPEGERLNGHGGLAPPRGDEARAVA